MFNKAQSLIQEPGSCLQCSPKCFQFQSSHKYFSFNLSSNEKENALSLIYQLYLYQGPCWKFISSQLNEEQFGNYFRFNNPKNFIYNSIRSSANTLAKYEASLLGNRRRVVCKDTLLSMLKIINQVQAEILARNLTLNQQSLLFKFKKKLLRFSLWEGSLTDEEILEMIRQMKLINLKLRCLSIFKSKHRKSWKISEKGFRLISSFDKIAMEERFWEVEVGESIVFQNEDQKVKEQYSKRLFEGQQQEGILQCNFKEIESFFLEKQIWMTHIKTENHQYKIKQEERRSSKADQNAFKHYQL